MKKYKKVIIWWAIICWWVTGMWSFKYWYTKDYSITMAITPVWALSGVCGPLGYSLGWMIHGEGEDFVIVKKVGAESVKDK